MSQQIALHPAAALLAPGRMQAAPGRARRRGKRSRLQAAGFGDSRIWGQCALGQRVSTAAVLAGRCRRGWREEAESNRAALADGLLSDVENTLTRELLSRDTQQLCERREKISFSSG